MEAHNPKKTISGRAASLFGLSPVKKVSKVQLKSIERGWRKWLYRKQFVPQNLKDQEEHVSGKPVKKKKATCQFRWYL